MTSRVFARPSPRLAQMYSDIGRPLVRHASGNGSCDELGLERDLGAR